MGISNSSSGTKRLRGHVRTAGVCRVCQRAAKEAHHTDAAQGPGQAQKGGEELLSIPSHKNNRRLED